MRRVHWIDRLEAAPRATAGPLSCIVWIVRHVDAAALPLPPAEAADLADAALAKREGGAARVLRRRLLRALAARVFAVHPAEVRFARDAKGRPSLKAPAAFISAAGCGAGDEAVSAVTLSSFPVGVDLAANEDQPASTRWALTEAYVKALGQGLAMAPESVRAERRSPQARCWRLTACGAPAAEAETRAAGSGIAAVALLSPPSAARAVGHTVAGRHGRLAAVSTGLACAALLSACQRHQAPAQQSPAPVASTSTAAAPPSPPTPGEQALLDRLPSAYRHADLENGRLHAGLCHACHTLTQGGPDMTGPNLYGVFGRKVASRPGYVYSAALSAKAWRWDAQHFDAWLKSPRDDVPGTKMTFYGIPDDEDRRDLIAYLKVATSPAP